MRYHGHESTQTDSRSLPLSEDDYERYADLMVESGLTDSRDSLPAFAEVRAADVAANTRESLIGVHQAARRIVRLGIRDQVL